MNQIEELQITISCLQKEVDRWSREWDALHERDEAGTLTKREEHQMMTLVESMTRFQKVISYLDECRRIAIIQDEDANWTEEKEREADELAHCEVTLEMEQGRDIPLTEWALNHGMDPSSARQKARRGKFSTARKVGRDWVISESEPNVDHRRRK